MPYFVYIRLDEAYVVKTGLAHASTGFGNGPWVPLDRHNLARRTHQSGYKHRYVSYPRPDIENTLSAPNARLTKESFGDGSYALSLPDQALVLGVGVAQWISSRAKARHGRCFIVG